MATCAADCCHSWGGCRVRLTGQQGAALHVFSLTCCIQHRMIYSRAHWLIRAKHTSSGAFFSMFTCDTGGELNKVTHFYSYNDMAQREAVRAAAAREQEWAAYVDAGRDFIQKQVGTTGLLAAHAHCGPVCARVVGNGPHSKVRCVLHALDMCCWHPPAPERPPT